MVRRSRSKERRSGRLAGRGRQEIRSEEARDPQAGTYPRKVTKTCKTGLWKGKRGHTESGASTDAEAAGT